MKINFLNKKENSSTLLVVFLVKSHEIKFLNKDTFMDTINDPDFNFLLFSIFWEKVN
jgi:hypothetical protein